MAAAWLFLLYGHEHTQYNGYTEHDGNGDIESTINMQSLATCRIHVCIICIQAQATLQYSINVVCHLAIIMYIYMHTFSSVSYMCTCTSSKIRHKHNTIVLQKSVTDLLVLVEVKCDVGEVSAVQE
jgi:hypothetical protein